jgi:hypothetical protein
MRYVFIPIRCLLTVVDDNYRLLEYDAVIICNALTTFVTNCCFNFQIVRLR